MLMIKFDIPRPPLVLALVLASLMEMSLRQSLLLSFGSPLIFVERPISAILLAAVVAAVVLPSSPVCAGGIFRRLRPAEGWPRHRVRLAEDRQSRKAVVLDPNEGR
jgi:TctA family transporter